MTLSRIPAVLVALFANVPASAQTVISFADAVERAQTSYPAVPVTLARVDR
jgi:hypothetical protein